MRYPVVDISNSKAARGDIKATEEDRQNILRICQDHLHFKDSDFGDLTEGKMSLLEWVYVRGAQESYLKIIAAFPSQRQRSIILSFNKHGSCDEVAKECGVTGGYVRVTLGHAKRMGIKVNYDPEKERAMRAKKRSRLLADERDRLRSKRGHVEDARNIFNYVQNKPSQPVSESTTVKHHMKVTDAPDGKVDFTIRISPMEIGVIIGALHEFRKNGI